jgi:two-component system, NtrC family, sensor kinase
MKKKFVLFILLFLVKETFCQDNYTDSLRQALFTANEDTNKVRILIAFGKLYQWSYPDSSIIYSRTALQLAQKLNFVEGEIGSYEKEAEAFSGKGNYPQALEASLKALELCEKSGDSTSIVWGYAHVGTVYYYSGDYERAIYYFNKLKLNHKIFLLNQKVFAGFLGETYFYLNNLDSALHYTGMSYDLDVKSERHWPVPYFYLGEIYAQRKEYDSSLNYYNTGINFSTAKLDFLSGYIGIAGVFKKMNLIDSAVYYAREAVYVVQDGSFPGKIAEASKILMDIYTNNRIIDSALKYMDIMMVAKDSLLNQAKQNLFFNEKTYQQELQQKIEQEQSTSRNRQNIIFLLAGLTILLLIVIGLWRKNIYKQKSYAILQKQKQEIDVQKLKVEKTLEELKTTQTQLIQSEKMASLGELTAGIAHEIQNPLNFVNNFSEVSNEMIDELNEDLDKGNISGAKTIGSEIKQNLEKINHHGKRADAIVKGMLQHSRVSTGQKEPTDINALCDEYLRLSYHGLRAKDKEFNAEIKTDFDETIDKIDIIPRDIGRVVLNLINNAFYTVDEKKKSEIENYKPTVSVTTKKSDHRIVITVSDNGNGIPQKIVDKIFQPFFTTKPTGQGTGLGLSLAYDIVTKGHGGALEVKSEEGAGTDFIITLPFKMI